VLISAIPAVSKAFDIKDTPPIGAFGSILLAARYLLFKTFNGFSNKKTSSKVGVILGQARNSWSLPRGAVCGGGEGDERSA